MRTAGPAVALRMTPIVNPNGGLRADGSDVLLIDVEAVDAKGERCPTFQQRVDFETKGNGIWRGGYNSGKTNSINNPYLDLECGINRVAVRATRTAGTITVRATSKGLKSASVTVSIHRAPSGSGYSTELCRPCLPGNFRPNARLRWLWTWNSRSAERKKNAQGGKFIKGFSYSGPTASVHMEQDAQDGKKILTDRDFSFTGLRQSTERRGLYPGRLR